MDTGHMKRCSLSLTMREMKIKITVSYHFTLVKMAIIKKYKKQVPERVWRKENPPTLLVGMQTSTATLENSVEIP